MIGESLVPKGLFSLAKSQDGTTTVLQWPLLGHLITPAPLYLQPPGDSALILHCPAWWQLPPLLSTPGLAGVPDLLPHRV